MIALIKGGVLIEGFHSNCIDLLFSFVPFFAGVCSMLRSGERSSTVFTHGSSTPCLVCLSPSFRQVSKHKLITLKIGESV